MFEIFARKKQLLIPLIKSHGLNDGSSHIPLYSMDWTFKSVSAASRIRLQQVFITDAPISASQPLRSNETRLITSTATKRPQYSPCHVSLQTTTKICLHPCYGLPALLIKTCFEKSAKGSHQRIDSEFFFSIRLEYCSCVSFLPLLPRYNVFSKINLVSAQLHRL